LNNKLISKIVIGTWSLSGDFGKIHKTKVYKSIEKAIENGLYEFDTSPNYGNGRMHKILSDIFRNEKKIIINTKCGYNSDSIKTFKIKDIRQSIETSLKQFRQINTIFLHNPRDEIKNWPKIIDLLKEYKKNNIKKIGISLARDFYFKKEIMNEFDYLQDEINLLRPNSISFLSSLKPKIMARSPLASGCLSGNLKINSKFSKKDKRSLWLSNKERLKNIIFQIKQLKKITGINLRQKSKFFLLQNNQIKKIIFGVKEPSHVEEIVRDLGEIKLFSKDKYKKILDLANSNFKLDLNKTGY
jgi:aryl-alcohol dehydrogenase-like predicted oxidoreductase